MVLAPHALIGASVACLAPLHPEFALLAGFMSHFVADALPHWHYAVGSISDDGNPLDKDMRIDRRQFPRDLAKISFDGLVGLGASLVLLVVPRPELLIPVVLGAGAGMLPDALQFVYFKWRHEPLTSLQRFHVWIHAKSNLDHMGVVGASFQFGIALVIVLLAQVWVGEHAFGSV